MTDIKIEGTPPDKPVHIYDIGTDSFRYATQEDFDKLFSYVNRYSILRNLLNAISVNKLQRAEAELRLLEKFNSDTTSVTEKRTTRAKK